MFVYVAIGPVVVVGAGGWAAARFRSSTRVERF